MGDVISKKIANGLYYVDPDSIAKPSLTVKVLMIAIMSGKLSEAEEKECREKMVELHQGNSVVEK